MGKLSGEREQGGRFCVKSVLPATHPKTNRFWKARVQEQTPLRGLRREGSRFEG